MKLSAEEAAILPWLALAAWFVWAWMETRGGRDERASQAAEVDHARTEAQGAARGYAPATVHRRMRAIGEPRGLVAGGPREGGDARGSADLREHRASAHSLQPEERRSDGCPRRELPTSTSAGHPPLVSRR